MKLLVFLFGCIASRLAITFIAYKYINVLPYMAIPALAIAIGMAIIYVFGLRKAGLEVSGKKIWWNHLRPFHASMYFWFSILAFKKSKYAWVPLFIDVFTGLSAFVWNYY